MPTDTTEKALESLIVAELTGQRSPAISQDTVRELGVPYGGAGYIQGDPADYDREHAVDLAKLVEFLAATQPETLDLVGVAKEGPRRRQFLARLQGEIAKRGVIDVLRRGVKHGPAHVDLFYGTPSSGNPKTAERFAANIFSVPRHLRYSTDDTQRALDLALFINGLPIATFELKNRLTKQTVEDAVQQEKLDRHPRELLFQFGRCVAHFAVDDQGVRFCTHHTGKSSWCPPL